MEAGIVFGNSAPKVEAGIVFGNSAPKEEAKKIVFVKKTRFNLYVKLISLPPSGEVACKRSAARR